MEPNYEIIQNERFGPVASVAQQTIDQAETKTETIQEDVIDVFQTFGMGFSDITPMAGQFIDTVSRYSNKYEQILNNPIISKSPLSFITTGFKPIVSALGSDKVKHFGEWLREAGEKEVNWWESRIAERNLSPTSWLRKMVFGAVRSVPTSLFMATTATPVAGALQAAGASSYAASAAAFGTAGMIVSGAQNASEMHKFVMETPDSDLFQTKAGQNAYVTVHKNNPNLERNEKKIMAKRLVADSFSDNMFLRSLPSGAVEGLFGGGIEGRLFTPIYKQIWRNFLEGTGAEMAEEFIQSPWEQYNFNVLQNKLTTQEIDPMSGVLESAVVGPGSAFLMGLMGTGVRMGEGKFLTQIQENRAKLDQNNKTYVEPASLPDTDYDLVWYTPGEFVQYKENDNIQIGEVVKRNFNKDSGSHSYQLKNNDGKTIIKNETEIFDMPRKTLDRLRVKKEAEIHLKDLKDKKTMFPEEGISYETAIKKATEFLTTVADFPETKSVSVQKQSSQAKSEWGKLISPEILVKMKPDPWTYKTITLDQRQTKAIKNIESFNTFGDAEAAIFDPKSTLTQSEKQDMALELQKSYTRMSLDPTYSLEEKEIIRDHAARLTDTVILYATRAGQDLVALKNKYRLELTYPGIAVSRLKETLQKYHDGPVVLPDQLVDRINSLAMRAQNPNLLDYQKEAISHRITLLMMDYKYKDMDYKGLVATATGANFYGGLLSGWQTLGANIIDTGFNFVSHVGADWIRDPSSIPHSLSGIYHNIAKAGINYAYEMRTGESRLGDKFKPTSGPSASEARVNTILAERAADKLYAPKSIFRYIGKIYDSMRFVTRNLSATDRIYYDLSDGHAREFMKHQLQTKFKDRFTDEQLDLLSADITGERKTKYKEFKDQVAKSGLTGLDKWKHLIELEEKWENEMLGPFRPVVEEYSQEFAAQVTYRQKASGLAGKIGRAANQVINSSSTTKFIGKPFLPIVDIAANLLNERLDWLGVPSLIDKSDLSEATLERKRIKAIAGTAAWVSLAILASTPSDPDNPDSPPVLEITGNLSSIWSKREQIERMGYPPWSFRINSKDGSTTRWYTYMTMPVIEQLGVLGCWNDSKKWGDIPEGEGLERLRYSLYNGSRSLTDMSVMRSLNEIVALASFQTSESTAMDRMLNTYTRSALTSVTPWANMLNQIERLWDPSKVARTDILHKILRNAPVIGKIATDKRAINILAEPISYASGRLLAPSEMPKKFEKWSKNDYIFDLMARKKVFISTPQYSTKYWKDNYMSPEMQYQLKYRAGKILSNMFAERLEMIELMTPEEAQTYMRKITSDVYKEVKAQMYLEEDVEPPNLENLVIPNLTEMKSRQKPPENPDIINYLSE
jgi:hypothetical protein